MATFTTYTPEQKAHLDAINRHLSSLEEKLHKNMLEICQHLTQSIETGMEVYRTFVITGQIIIEPDSESIPDEISDKFIYLDDCIIEIAGEKTDIRRFQQDYERRSRYDWHYFKHPEDYPENCYPQCRSFDLLIRDNLTEGKFSIEDLMHVTSDDICTYIKIHI